MNQAYLFFEYGVRWFIPASGWMSISLRPPFPVTWASFPQVLGVFGYLAVIVGGFFLVVRYRDWRALVGISLLFPALLFATEFATVWVQDPFVLYRSYLWAIGAPGLVFFVVHGSPARVLLAIGIALGSLFVWQARDRVMSLATPEAAWTDAIAKFRNDPRAVGRWFAYLNRGSDYVERNQFALAMKDFEASAALGDLGMGTVNMGSLLAAAGRHQQALAAFDRAEKEGYNLYNLPFQRGLSLLALGKPAEAYAQFKATQALNPPSPTRELLLLNLGRTALLVGRNAEAVTHLQALADSGERSNEARFLLGMALISTGEHARAHELLDRLVKEGGQGAAYYGRALANYGLRRKAEALSDIENAIRLGPNNPNLREWRAKIQAMP
jgi:tetratricopeptide (TPR) repeat protein